MRGLPFFKPKKGAQFAGLGFSDGSGGGCEVDNSMIAGTESTNTSTHAYNVGDYFINASGQLCKATDDIAVNDTISVGTGSGDNCVATTVGGELSELNSKFVLYYGHSNTGWEDAANNISNIPSSVKNEIIFAGNHLDSGINQSTVASGIISIADGTGGSFGAVIHVMSSDWMGGVVIGYRLGWEGTLIWFSKTSGSYYIGIR